MAGEPFSTHDVFNQTPPFGDVDLYGGDPALVAAVRAFGRPTNAQEVELSAFGRRWGQAEFAEWGRLANDNTPELRTYDSRGFRADVVEFHPAYHALMKESVAAGIHSSTWRPDGTTADAAEHVVRAAKLGMAAEVEAGHLCPIVMTHAATAALGANRQLVADWLPGIRSREYDASFRPAPEKAGFTLGMGMTEKQGGTDVRANTTRAEPDGDAYRVTGHKWFLSAPMCDAFLVLAQAKGGLTCFLLPRFRPDGTVNALRLRRLKDKLGNRSNASSEAEFEDAYAVRCGPEGEGIKTIIAMVQLTRLDCAVTSAAYMRAGLAQAIHHARYRSVFQKKLVDQPLMRTVLADLALEREGATALSMRLAAAFGRTVDADEAAFARIVTPAAKLWICKSAPGYVYEAMECLGGNGYVEELPLARLYREVPVNAIWEGSGNVMALDLLRGAERDKEGLERVLAMLVRAVDDLPGARAALERVRAAFGARDREVQARRTAETLAHLAAAAALKASAPPAIAEAFVVQRFNGSGGRLYGNPMAGSLVSTVLERSLANA